MPKRDMVKLWVRAGGRCTICEKDVQEDGQEGHIVSFGKNGPRADPNYPTHLINRYENRILTCPNCHTKIDQTEPKRWPTERLLKRKARHEANVNGEQTRTDRLLEIKRAAKARSIARWRAAGISQSDAESLVDDKLVGQPPGHLCRRGVTVLCAPMGAGKSLTIDRLVEAAVDRNLSSQIAPVPIYLDATTVSEGLEQACLAASGSIGNPRIQGAAVFIDRADELGTRAILQLLDEARVLVGTWRYSTAVITTRWFDREDEDVVTLPPLDSDSARALISRLVKRDVGEGQWASWPEAVRTAALRPLFAVLLAGFLSRGGTRPTTAGQLVSDLAERSLTGTRMERLRKSELLRDLARRVTDQQGRPVLTRDLESPEDARPVLELGLITEEDGLLSFSLPIFTHWFAAQSLAQLRPDIREIAADRRRLDRWRGALTVAVGILSEQHVSRIMSAIVEHDPALAACLITEELDTWRSGELPHLPNLHECGQRIVDSAERWALGLGPLSREFRPFLRQPHSQLGVAGNASTLVTSWNLSESSPPVVELVDARQVWDPGNSNWFGTRLGHPPPSPGWPWLWSLDYFVGAIDRAIENRRFPMTKRLLLERAWKVAGDLDRWTTIQRESLSLADFRNLFAQYSPNTVIQTGTAHYEVKSLNDLVDELESLGFTEIRDPWPSKDVPNIRGRWIWSQYSAERMLERATEVYSAALEAYELWTSTVLASVRSRLTIGGVLPGLVVGEVVPPRTDKEDHEVAPQINWHVEPLPLNETSRAALHLGTSDLTVASPRGEPDYGRLITLYRDRRPEFEWLHPVFHYSILDVFFRNSAVELAYEWVAHDLRALRLSRRGFSRRL